MEVGVQVQEQVDSGEKVEARERERGRRQNKETTNAQTREIMVYVPLLRVFERVADSALHDLGFLR